MKNRIMKADLLKKIEIIHETEDFLVINKPSGLVVHPDGRTSEKTLVDWILEKYPEIEGVGEPLTLSDGRVIFRPGIVHRIDRETSGVLLIAKNQKTFLHLKEQFKNSEVSKKYNAFVYGMMKDDEGLIDRPIGKSKKDFRLRSAQRGAGGKIREAITEFKVLKKTSGFSFLEVYPKTGRTHQIRVHLKAINHPVVHDELYAPKRIKEINQLEFERLALHAGRIEFTDLSGKSVYFEAPLPDDFEKALFLLGK